MTKRKVHIQRFGLDATLCGRRLRFTEGSESNLRLSHPSAAEPEPVTCKLCLNGGQPTDAQLAARLRNSTVRMLRCIYSNAKCMSFTRQDKVRALIEEELESLGAETEDQRKIRWSEEREKEISS